MMFEVGSGWMLRLVLAVTWSNLTNDEWWRRVFGSNRLGFHDVLQFFKRHLHHTAGHSNSSLCRYEQIISIYEIWCYNSKKLLRKLQNSFGDSGIIAGGQLHPNFLAVRQLSESVIVQNFSSICNFLSEFCSKFVVLLEECNFLIHLLLSQWCHCYGVLFCLALNLGVGWVVITWTVLRRRRMLQVFIWSRVSIMRKLHRLVQQTQTTSNISNLNITTTTTTAMLLFPPNLELKLDAIFPFLSSSVLQF